MKNFLKNILLWPWYYKDMGTLFSLFCVVNEIFFLINSSYLLGTKHRPFLQQWVSNTEEVWYFRFISTSKLGNYKETIK